MVNTVPKGYDDDDDNNNNNNDSSLTSLIMAWSHISSISW